MSEYKDYIDPRYTWSWDEIDRMAPQELQEVINQLRYDCEQINSKITYHQEKFKTWKETAIKARAHKERNIARLEEMVTLRNQEDTTALERAFQEVAEEQGDDTVKQMVSSLLQKAKEKLRS